MSDSRKRTYEKPALVRHTVLARVTAFATLVPSDRRLKTNIARVGTTVFGLPLYRFSYLGGEARFTGVMAQDVLEVMPAAVSRGRSGFYQVDYGMLGIEMSRAA